MSEGLSTAAAWKVAGAGLCALALALGIGRFAYTPLLPMMQADLGMSLQTGSWLALTNMAGYLLGGLSGRFLTGHPVRHARLALLCITASVLGMALTSNVIVWSLLRLTAGIASAWMMIMVSMLTLPRLVATPRMAGFVYAGVGSGIALAGALCTLFVFAGLSANQAWVALAVMSALLGVPLWRVFKSGWDRKPDSIQASKPESPQRNGQHERRLWLLVICYGLYGFGYILPATYLPAQARILLQDSWSYSLAWPVFGAAAALSTLVASLVAARFGHLRTWLGAQTLLLLGVLAPIFWHDMGGILFAAVCVGGTFVVITLVAMQVAQQHGAGRSSLWMARLTAAFGLGQVSGPAVIVMLDGQLVPGLWLAAVALTVSLAALVWQTGRDRVLDPG